MSTEIYLPHLPEPVIHRHRLGTNAGTRLETKIETKIGTTQNLPWLDATTLAARTPDSIDTRQPQTESHHISPISPWCASASKRAFDLACVLPALALISPLLGIVAIAVRCTSSGPVIFRQQRAGRHRKLFTIYKFRTMVENSESIGPGHTAKGDPRITPFGKFLRRFKLDELPQLYNVLRGDMSLVGPRPKLPHHDRTLMVCRPGVTGAATLAFRDEQRILCEVPAERLEAFYQEHVVPRKIHLDANYMSRATFITDLRVLFATIAPGGSYLMHNEIFLSSGRSAESKASQAPIALESQWNIGQ